MNLVVHRINPFSRADQIKDLFRKHERPEFSDWFDRAYPIAMRDGGSTWVSLDSEDRVVAHMSVFRSAFWLHDEVVSGGLLCNLMADQAHRTFFPVAALIKRAVKELREEGIDFLYTNPINKASIAVMRAAGLSRIGDQHRYVLPVADHKLLLDVVARAYVSGRRLARRGYRAVRVEPSAAAEWTIQNHCRVSNVTAKRHPELYFMRYGDQGGLDTLGFAIFGPGGSQVGASIVRMEPRADGLASIVTMRCQELASVAGTTAALGAAARAEGVKRLNEEALADTSFTAALLRGGFLDRGEPWTIVGAGYTDRGRSVIEGMSNSDLEKIDVD